MNPRAQALRRMIPIWSEERDKAIKRGDKKKVARLNEYIASIRANAKRLESV